MCKYCISKQSQPVQEGAPDVLIVDYDDLLVPENKKIPLGVGKTIGSHVVSFNAWQTYIRQQVANLKK